MVYVAIDETDPKVEDGPRGRHVSSPMRTAATSAKLRGPRGVVVLEPVVAAGRSPAEPGPGRARCSAPRETTFWSEQRSAELIYGRGGNDLIRGRGGDDIIVGDVPFARARGKDRLYGGPGRDFIDSYDGRRDLVDGGAGRDRGISDRHDRVRSVERYG